MRFWVQAVKLSPSVSYRFIVNDQEVTSGEVIFSSIIIRLLPWQLRNNETLIGFSMKRGEWLVNDLGNKGGISK